MKLKPLGDKIVVKRDEAPNKTPGGLHLPDGAKEKPQTGKVIAVGPGRMNDDGKLIPIPLTAGNKVWFTAWAGNVVTHEGEDFVVMSVADVLLVEP